VRIVLDTNVLISGVLNPHGAPGSILNAVLNKAVTLLLDDRILFEYREVLLRPKFRFPIDYIQSLLEFLEYESTYIIAGPSSALVTDSDDIPFYEVAISGRADYLVTGNDKHFPPEQLIVSPHEFVDVLRGAV
jgi:putative PIN family toxin of toxin-antitoxin system